MTVTDDPAIPVSTEDLLSLYEQMAVIRRTEKAAHDLFLAGLVKGTTHLAAGHEAVAVGASAALRPDDYVFATYRGHHHAIARGATPAECLAELMSKGTGICKAKGGSMHLTKASAGMLGSYAIVGAHLPMAAGAAWSAKLRGTGEIAVAFFGDGATNIGAFHEALNLAAVWSLPVLFVCENNLYMEYTPIGQVTAVPSPAADRAPAYGLTGRDRSTATTWWRWPRRWPRRPRGPGPAAGPTLIEALTYRHFGHSRTDPAKYRPAEEVAQWMARDPLELARRRLADAGVPASSVTQAAERAAETVAAGDSRRQGGATTRTGRRIHRRMGGRRLGMADLTTYREAVAEGIAREMRRDPAVVCLGEDIGAAGGVFKTAAGLFEEFGPERIWDTPISEQAILGAAMGAAMTGHAPGRGDHVLRLLRLLLGLPGQRDPEDALHDRRPGHRAAGGPDRQRRRPRLRRAALPGGGELGADRPRPQDRRPVHPGRRGRHDGRGHPQRRPGGLLRAQGPVRQQGLAGAGGACGRARPGRRRPRRHRRHPGRPGLHGAAGPGRRRAGWPPTASPPRSSTCARLIPLDMATVLASVRRTSRLIIVEENPYQGGWGGTVASIVADEGFESLDAPIRRVAAACVPLPFADALEQEVIPTTAKVVTAIRSLASY